MRLVVRDYKVRLHAPYSSPRDFLRSHANRAYTTARTSLASCCAFIEWHASRLIHSMQLISGSYQRLDTPLYTVPPPAFVSQLAQHIECVLSAFKRLRQHANTTSDKDGGELMLVIVAIPSLKSCSFETFAKPLPEVPVHWSISHMLCVEIRGRERKLARAKHTQVNSFDQHAVVV